MDEDEIKEIDSEPLEVKIKKEEPTKQPSFDYDDYNPSDSEILEIEAEIAEKIKERTKNG